MPKIVDTYNVNYPLIEGKPFTDYNADEEFLRQMNKHFNGVFHFDVLSRKGRGSRTDVLLRGRFTLPNSSSNTFYIYVFILYEGGAGRAHDDELRTQLGPGVQWSTDLAKYKAATVFRDSTEELKNRECYCIGIYKQDKECDNVLFVGMPAEVLCKSENERINPTSAFQTYGTKAREAYLKGIKLHEKSFTASSTYNLLLFKPEYFLWYMKNRDQLHVGDIDSALEIIKETPHVIIPKSKLSKDNPLQQIFYGAPGTGKSKKTNEVAEQYSTIRTTFHPDSDYSTFVGSYKPTSVKRTKYFMDGSIAKQMLYAQDDPEENVIKGEKIKESSIEYKFVKQAFLKAYVNAWKLYAKTFIEDQEVEPQFLVIEEINRGNCAQIFGDLFQLLDRKNGYSEYPIESDEDIRKSLLCKDEKDNPGFGESGLRLSESQKYSINKNYNNPGEMGNTIADKISNGTLLVLPPNFYIWATMNTSDQSLFPIDSAFKRRWDWQYMPIANAYKDWKICIGNAKFDWWRFVEKINIKIETTTNSEDKKLGYFFCKASDKKIDAKTFVGKVVFYLWNDVFKDYDFEGPLFVDEDGKKLTFDKFYGTQNGEPVILTSKVLLFLRKLDAEIDPEILMEETTNASQYEASDNSNVKFSLDGGTPMSMTLIAKQVVANYSNQHLMEGAEQIRDVFNNACGRIIVETEDEFNTRLANNPGTHKGQEITLPNGSIIYVTNQWQWKAEQSNFAQFMAIAHEKGWGEIVEVKG